MKRIPHLQGSNFLPTSPGNQQEVEGQALSRELFLEDLKMDEIEDTSKEEVEKMLREMGIIEGDGGGKSEGEK